MENHCYCTHGRLILIAMTLGMFFVPTVTADQATDARIKKLEDALKGLQAEIAQLKAERTAEKTQIQAVDQEQIDTMVGKAIESQKSDILGIPDWIENIEPFGDFRYRHESVRNTGAETVGHERRRNRIRVRLGFKAKINEEIDAIFRIASGSSDAPTTTNQTMDGAFTSKDLWLDLGYADWHPGSMPGLNVFAGKMRNPFYDPGKAQLIWDSDVNPEGGAASYKWDLNSSTAATVTGGAFWLDERETDADAGYFGIQGMVKRTLERGDHLIGGVGYYDIGNIDNKTIGGVTLEGNTATSSGSGIYKYDYDVLEYFGEYGFNCGKMPVSIFGTFAENTAAPSGRNNAFSVGALFNKAREVGSWHFAANYREVESDAVFGGLSNSDFIDGGTGGKGWMLAYRYQLARNLQTGLSVYLNDRDRRDGEGSGGSGSQHFERVQADMIFKF